MDPFFSVCIPLHNREKTIFETLLSLTRQEFKNFEVKIVDCGSIDKTRTEVDLFLKSHFFKDNPFNYEYVCREYIPKTIEDWNEPVKMAKGKYIAMLEGDDQFLPDHLLNAYEYLVNHQEVGIYATGNINKPFKKKGYILAKKYHTFIYSLKEVPPPSQAIFIRKNGQVTYLYNETDCVYAPEIDLYLRIANDGYNTYYSLENTVYRYPSSAKLRDDWSYYQDHLFILKKYSKPLTIEKFLLQIIAKINVLIRCCSVYTLTDSKLFKGKVLHEYGRILVCLFLLIRFIWRNTFRSAVIKK